MKTRRRKFLSIIILTSALIFIFGGIGVYGQQPNIEWQKIYPMSKSLEDCAVVQADDGDYIIAGTKKNASSYSGYVFFMRIDEQGNTEDYYEINVPYRYARSIGKCKDGSFVIVGSQYIPRGGSAFDCDLWVCKITYSEDPYSGKHFLEESGITDKTISNVDWGSWGGWAIQQTVDTLGNPNGYIIAANRYEKPKSNNKEYIYLLKLKEDFEEEWGKTYKDGSYGDFGISVKETDDEGYILAGWRYDNNTYKYSTYILKTDDQGNAEWEKEFKSISLDGDDYTWDIDTTGDGGYVIAGQSAASERIGYTIKLNSNGNISWTHTYPISSSGSGYIGRSSVITTKDEGYLAADVVYDPTSYATHYNIVKMSASGSEEGKQQIIGYNNNTSDIVRDLITTKDGGALILGTYDHPYGLCLIKLEPDQVDMEVKVSAIYKEEDGQQVLDIKATAICLEDDDLTEDNTLSAEYEVLDEDDNPIGISGSLLWNEDTEKWEALGVDISSVIDVSRKVSVAFEDENNHKGAGESQISKDAKLGLSSYNIMADGNVLVYATLTDITDQRDTSGNAELTIKLAGSKDEYVLYDTGEHGDLSPNDGQYGLWLDIPGSVPTIIELYLGEEKVDSEIINVTSNPELAVITNISALYTEFRDTGTAVDEDTDDNGVIDFYDLLEGLAQYAKHNNGVVFNLYQEVLVDKGYYDDYSSLTYGTDTSDMSRNIDLLVYKISTSQSLKNVAIIGDDEVVPFCRRTDPIGWESGYYHEMSGGAGNPTIADSGNGFIMSDIPYGSYDCRHPDDEQMPLLDAGVGRIFADHPMELIKIMSGYQMPVLLNNAAIYQAEEDENVDFVSLVEHTLLPIMDNNYLWGALSDTFDSGYYYHYDRISCPEPEGWSAMDFTEALSNVGLNMLWTHADHGSANTYKNSPITANNNIKIMHDAPGHILLTPACHSGYSISHNSTTGNYGYYDNALAKAFMQKQISYLASTTYGIVMNEYVAYHERMLQKYLQNLLDTSNNTVGEVLIDAYSDFWQTIDKTNIEPDNVYAAYGVCYYGLPTQPIAPTNNALRSISKKSLDMTSSKEDTGGNRAKLSVEINPDFKIEDKVDGRKLFSVVDEDELYIHAYAPVMPIVVKSYELPGDAAINEVNLINFETIEYEGEVELPTAIPVNMSTGPIAGSFEMPETYPENMYWWRAEEADGKTILNLSVVPMQYTDEDKKVTLYKHMEFEIVRSHGALTIDSNSLPYGNEGEAYYFDLEASGGVEPYEWWASGLPEGLTVRTEGAITGKPVSHGTSNVTITVRDSVGTEVNKTFSLTINQNDQKPLTIDTMHLPTGKEKKTYHFDLEASGGVEPYRWNAIGLPHGLNVRTEGAITGVPNKPGTFDVMLTVLDADDNETSKTFTLSISRRSSNHNNSSRSKTTQNENVTEKKITLFVNCVEASIDEQIYMLDAAPFIDEEAGRTLVPIRFVSEALGATVQWNQELKQVNIRDGEKEIVLTIGSKDVLVNGEIITIDCAPIILPPGRTYVPLRFISETLGAEVLYTDETKKIEIVQ